MSTSLVHTLTIIGIGAIQIETACDELLGRRVKRSPRSHGTDDWSESDRKDIEGLCTTLIGAARSLPVVYYAEYLDSWDVANSRFRSLPWPDGKKREICGSGFGMAWYPSRHAEAFLTQIKRLRRSKLYREQAEDRWFVDHIKEALEVARWLQAPFLVVAISQCLGPSRLDEEIKKALDMPIWPS